MRVTIVGCSGSFAGPLSPASCYLVRAAYQGRDWSILLDLGSGALGALQRHMDPLDLDAVLLSHLHPDHCLDITGLFVMRRYAPHRRPEGRLAMWGPAGTKQSSTSMYFGSRKRDMESTYEFGLLGDGLVMRIGPFSVTAVLVNHPVETYGFRVEAGGAVLAYSGDTDSCPALTPLFTGADLVLVDSAFVDGRDQTRDIHLTGSRAAQAAVDAGGVKRLMLTHIPAWNDPEVCRAQAATVWPGEVEVAEPDATYEL